MQIRYKAGDYDLYKKWTAECRYKKLAFMFALFKVRNDAHLHCVVSGEFSQGKSATAITLARYDQKYTRRLLKMFFPDTYEAGKGNLKFTVEDSIIISPRDPAAKAIKTPKPWKSYVADEAMLFGTTAEAGTHKVRRLRDNIAQNRKLHPSFYWAFPNIFKMPSAILELMDVCAHKENVKTGDIIMPSRVVQLKEKFDKDTIARYAKWPRLFPRLIRYHPSFIAKAKFPKLSGRGWKAYLIKYDKYKTTEDGDDRVSGKEKFFTQIEGLIEKKVITVNAKKDIQNVVQSLLAKKAGMSEASAESLAITLTDDFTAWREEKVISKLTKDLSKSVLAGIDAQVEIDKDAVEAG